MSQRVDPLHYCQLRPFKPSRLAPPLPSALSFPLSCCRLLHHRHVALQSRESTSMTTTKTTTTMSPATALVRSTEMQADLECCLQARQLDNNTSMVYRCFSFTSFSRESTIYHPSVVQSVFDQPSISLRSAFAGNKRKIRRNSLLGCSFAICYFSL